ncbi:MAG TPA: ATP-binding protein [Candidatus Deferrimicrobium sp.]|nr:ATP-binding protein [Candidatus Deferrimicrobium sp.]
MSKKAKEVVGNLIGVTKPNYVDIVIDPKVTRTKPLEIGEYVVIDYPSEVLTHEVLALVIEIGLQNENIPDYLMRSPESYEQLGMLGDLTEGERLTAKARIVGYYDPVERNVFFPRFPPVPGAQVYRANVDNLAQVFSAGHIRIGHLRAHPEVEVKVNVEELVRRHTAILAITGAGKGNTVAVTAARILELNGSVVIIDPHEEYPELKKLYTTTPNPIVVFYPGGDRAKGYFPIYFRWNNFTTEEIFDILEIREGATRQRALLREILGQLEGTQWDIDDFDQALDRYVLGDESLSEEDKKEHQKNMKEYKAARLALKDHISGIRESMILNKVNETPIAEEDTASLVAKGQITVICLSGLPLRIQQVVVGRICKKIYEAGVAWRRNFKDKPQLPCPTFLVVEESHNFIPAEGGSKSSAPINRIAAEGRKFGIGLCIVSQRPNKIDQNVLSQCNSQIILKVVNPKDQSQIANSCEAISTELMEDLPSLNKGEAVVVGSCILLPALVKIDKFWGSLGGDDIPVLKFWKASDVADNEKQKENSKKKRTDTQKFEHSKPLI